MMHRCCYFVSFWPHPLQAVISLFKCITRNFSEKCHLLLLVLSMRRENHCISLLHREKLWLSNSFTEREQEHENIKMEIWGFLDHL